jgi:hypothetical protein
LVVVFAQSKKKDFCVRLKLKVKDFFESDESEQIVTFKLPKKDFKKLAVYPKYSKQR